MSDKPAAERRVIRIFVTSSFQDMRTGLIALAHAPRVGARKQATGD